MFERLEDLFLVFWEICFSPFLSNVPPLPFSPTERKAPQDGRCGTYCSELLHHTSVVFTDEGGNVGGDLWCLGLAGLFFVPYREIAPTSGGVVDILTQKNGSKFVEKVIPLKFAESFGSVNLLTTQRLRSGCLKNDYYSSSLCQLQFL